MSAPAGLESSSQLASVEEHPLSAARDGIAIEAKVKKCYIKI
jgi:hypothetical protein